ncbi:glycosyltransferase family 2 protein [Cellulomonas fimi]|uniref:Glycosyl transferase family 2 n=1 Tax=Cellulomonas fimi (strain ATCC 484 / DSM 20113 / JCM 1341 / CCUG 24087 / LMG 16345 / NBRC 15513 / NCIMB 8980 / NCTC 7547 / NRS-133) TaxID=590998 RepID=F4H2E8_CELFA|nr:cellulose synthase catalytic subunit [Cellulomonas fimi]AEE47568.1 glycosyl transferase family 2 [Cellulomonas fimi ATCC 484]NNH07923.1 glycosyltransferase [Cellulomonas fimi]VEH36553.1 Cellulose synthase catalytic subunit [UDP-forming] [Cellulomonas fimi]
MATTFDRLVIEPRRTESERIRPTSTPENVEAQSPSLLLLVLLAAAGVIIYAVFLLNPANRGDWLPYTMVMVAETILVLHALLAMWTVLSSGHNPRTFAFHLAQDRLYDLAEIVREKAERRPQDWRMHLQEWPVDIDVFITTYGEDLDTIRRTVSAAVAMQGRHDTYVLDDGRSDEVRDLAAELGARYVRRLSSNGAKAGNINHALSLTRGDFFVVFDADFIPKPEFLHETVPFFASDDVAFVQTPQTYGNLHTVISRGAGYMQAVFYRFVQPGRNRFNAAFCVGTNVIFRRAAIDSVGGIYSDSKSEDVWTSLMLHEKGWRTIYIPTTLAVGDTPETVEAYTKQQQRWATGGFEIMLTHNPLSPRRRLTMDQRLMYTVTATHYLTGIAPLLLLLVPPLQIFFDLTPMNLTITPLQWALYYAGFYVLQVVLAFYTLGSFRWEVLLLASVSFPIYTRALVNALLRREQKWHVTGQKGAYRSPFAFMMPQVLFFVLLLLTTVVGVWKDLGNGYLSLALAWNATNTLILGGFVVTAWKEGHAGRLAARAEQRARRLAETAAPTTASDTARPQTALTGGAA